jgi:uncharacterized membrane protein SpoIIM required for sporulation/ABC-type transport system involved in multi-copper enzyme maturation permease subunit
MKNDLHLTWLIARRELVDQMRDWRILMPMIILVLFFPYLMNFAAFRSVEFVNQYGANLIAERIVPFFLMVVGFFPATVSLVVALESFVGEKERGTIEPMLSSPLADWHMYVGKLIAGSLAPLVACYTSMAIYLIGLPLQSMPFPPLDVLIQMFLLTAVQAVLMVSAAMVISTQSTSVRSANLLASFIVIPVGLLIQGESALIFWGTNQVLWLAVIGVAVITGLLIRLGLAHFQREALIGREIDVLNLRWASSELWRNFSGSPQAPASLRWLFRPRQSSLAQALREDFWGLFAWYRLQVFPTLKKMRVSIALTTLIGVLAIGGAYAFIRINFADFSPSTDDLQKILAELNKLLLDQQPTEGQELQVPEITTLGLFTNNLRAELILSFLGIFSFGVAGLLIFGLNFGLIGGVLGVVDVVKLPALELFVIGVLPHGIFELPSLMLVTASVLHMGARLVTPNARISIGEVFIETLGDWLKILLGLGIPLLLIAALIEANLTPILLYNFFKDSLLAGR